MVGSIQTIGRQLSSRLIFTFVGIILITAMVSGAFAYWLIYNELEEQSWARAADGQQMTLILLESEKTRLDALVTLAAQRPTLRRLLQEGEVAAITRYVRAYQFDAEVDNLAVYDANTQLLTTSNTGLQCSPPNLSQTVDYCVVGNAKTQLALTAGHRILDESTGNLLGYVTIGVFLDEAFVQRLANETELGQSFFVDDQPIVTSLDNIDAAIYNRALSSDDATGDFPLTSTLTINGSRYNTIRFPLHTPGDQPMIQAEVALPVTKLVKVERQILLTLIASTFVVAIASSIAVWMLRYAIKEEALKHLRSHFLANITHEFRTPLSALRASVEFLVDEMDHLSRPEINKLLGAIHMSVTGLQTLIDNLLESINIEAGHFAIRPRAIDIHDVVSLATHIMQPLLNRREQSLTVSFVEPLPHIYGDSTRLVQVLVNLLSNASKYGPMGKAIELDVMVNDANLIQVSVADQGSGIPLIQQDNLFRRFSRLDTTGSAQQGIGLGLWVVQAIVSEHDGTVGIRERPGGGSIFWFTVPIAPAAENAET